MRPTDLANELLDYRENFLSNIVTLQSVVESRDDENKYQYDDMGVDTRKEVEDNPFDLEVLTTCHLLFRFIILFCINGTHLVFIRTYFVYQVQQQCRKCNYINM